MTTVDKTQPGPGTVVVPAGVAYPAPPPKLDGTKITVDTGTRKPR